MKRTYDKELSSEELAALPDEDVDCSDIPELDASFWEKAEVRMPDKTGIYIKLDTDVLCRVLHLVDDFRALRIRRYRHAPLWSDIWNSRQNLTAYDACYAALARQLDPILVTRDQRLARALHNKVDIQIV